MKKELIPFIMAGDPHLEATEVFAQTLIAAGVRTIEIGVPFSDPLADGPVISRAAMRALSQKTGLTAIFALIAGLTKRHSDLRIILFTYLNPILSYGLETYTRSAKLAGIAASLVVDMPIEEADDHIRLHKAAELGTIFLASPTTSRERLTKIAAVSTPMIYYVSRAGVTGEQIDISTTLADELKIVRSVTSSPLALGFGISTPQQVAKVARFADSVVVGSRFVRAIERSHTVAEAAAEIRTFADECLKVLESEATHEST